MRLRGAAACGVRSVPRSGLGVGLFCGLFFGGLVGLGRGLLGLRLFGFGLAGLLALLDAGVGGDDLADDVFGEGVFGGAGEALPADDAVGRDDHDVGDALDAEGLFHAGLGVDGLGVGDLGVAEEAADLAFGLVGDADDDEVVLELLLELVEFGDEGAAG